MPHLGNFLIKLFWLLKLKKNNFLLHRKGSLAPFCRKGHQINLSQKSLNFHPNLKRFFKKKSQLDHCNFYSQSSIDCKESCKKLSFNGVVAKMGFLYQLLFDKLSPGVLKIQIKSQQEIFGAQKFTAQKGSLAPFCRKCHQINSAQKVLKLPP